MIINKYEYFNNIIKMNDEYKVKRFSNNLLYKSYFKENLIFYDENENIIYIIDKYSCTQIKHIKLDIDNYNTILFNSNYILCISNIKYEFKFYEIDNNLDIKEYYIWFFKSPLISSMSHLIDNFYKYRNWIIISLNNIICINEIYKNSLEIESYIIELKNEFILFIIDNFLFIFQFKLKHLSIKKLNLLNYKIVKKEKISLLTPYNYYKNKNTLIILKYNKLIKLYFKDNNLEIKEKIFNYYIENKIYYKKNILELKKKINYNFIFCNNYIYGIFKFDLKFNIIKYSNKSLFEIYKSPCKLKIPNFFNVNDNILNFEEDNYIFNYLINDNFDVIYKNKQKINSKIIFQIKNFEILMISEQIWFNRYNKNIKIINLKKFLHLDIDTDYIFIEYLEDNNFLLIILEENLFLIELNNSFNIVNYQKKKINKINFLCKFNDKLLIRGYDFILYEIKIIDKLLNINNLNIYMYGDIKLVQNLLINDLGKLIFIGKNNIVNLHLNKFGFFKILNKLNKICLFYFSYKDFYFIEIKGVIEFIELKNYKNWNYVKNKEEIDLMNYLKIIYYKNNTWMIWINEEILLIKISFNLDNYIKLKEDKYNGHIINIFIFKDTFFIIYQLPNNIFILLKYKKENVKTYKLMIFLKKIKFLGVSNYNLIIKNKDNEIIILDYKTNVINKIPIDIAILNRKNIRLINNNILIVGIHRLTNIYFKLVNIYNNYTIELQKKLNLHYSNYLLKVKNYENFLIIFNKNFIEIYDLNSNNFSNFYIINFNYFKFKFIDTYFTDNMFEIYLTNNNKIKHLKYDIDKEEVEIIEYNYEKITFILEKNIFEINNKYDIKQLIK